MNHAVISATGGFLPKRVLSNQELETILDTSDEWITSRTGIDNRFIANKDETSSYMAGEAAKAALKNWHLSADAIDLIIVATSTPDHIFPSVACFVQSALEISRPIPAFDVSVACSGFVYALDIAKQYISSGAAAHVMVIGSETMSLAVDWADRSTCILFGDGAGAVILSQSAEPGILASVLHAKYDHERLLAYPNGLIKDEKSFLSMQGNDVFKLAVNVMSEVVDEILTSAQLQKSDINWLIPHQANIRIIKAIAKKLSLPMSQVIVTIDRQGNTSAASIPLALDESIRSQQIKKGDVILLEAFGGGMTWGAMVIRY